MKGAMKIAAAMAASAAVVGEAIDTSCHVTGKTYSQASVEALATPNGAYTGSPSDCQNTCNDLPFCDKFSWIPDSTPAGACYLYGVEAIEKDQANAVSGPKACVAVVTDANDTQPAAFTGAGTASKEGTTGDVVTGDSSEKTLFAGTSSDGGIPWYAIVGAGLGAAAVGAGAFALIGGASSSDKKTKRSLKEEAGAPKKAWQLYAKMVDPDLTFPADAEQGVAQAPAGFPMPVTGGVQMVSMQPLTQMAPMPGYVTYSPVQYAPVSEAAPMIYTAPPQYVEYAAPTQQYVQYAAPQQ